MKEDRDKLRNQLYKLLGDLPDKSLPISSRLVSVEEYPLYFLERLVLDINGLETVPTYVTSPKSNNSPLPYIVYNHAHGGDYDLGKDELLLGRKALQDTPYADVFSILGFGTICIDAWSFGERKGRTEQSIFKDMLWNGRVMWGMMVYDTIRAIDYLISRDDVDSNRIGTFGISMGSTMAWWTAALDTRIKVCVDMCCLTDFGAISKRGLDSHGVYYFVPSLLKYFTTGKINSLIAPRPHLGLAGNYDKLTPPEGLDLINDEVTKAYSSEGALNAWKLLRYNIGHFETAEMRSEVISFFKKWL